MIKERLQDLLDYNREANLLIIEKAQELGKNFPHRTRDFFSHMINAHHIWNKRIVGEAIEFGVFENHKISTWDDLDLQNFNMTVDILYNQDLEREISYRNTKGITFQNSITEIVFHIVNHSTYHRGQIAIDFRNNDLDPLITDYILLRR